MIFVDTWAWVALALKLDQFHQKAKRAHKQLLRANRQYVVSDYVLSEVIAHLYTTLPAVHAQSYVNSILAAADRGTYQLATSLLSNSVAPGSSARNTTTNRTSPSSISPVWSSCRILHCRSLQRRCSLPSGRFGLPARALNALYSAGATVFSR